MSRGGVGTGAAVGMANRHGYQTGAGPQAGQNPSHAGKEVLRELVSQELQTHSHQVTRESLPSAGAELNNNWAQKTILISDQKDH